MVKKTIITCDVVGCKEEGCKEVECCRGYMLEDDEGKHRRFEKPTSPEKTDLCLEHYRKWSKITCKFLKMDVEIK